jgi:23S rRNA (uracil1939-C5)-methyltransferase
MLSSGQTLSLQVEKPAAGGRMIARVDGQVVLVSGAIPGEQVTVRVERVGRGVAYADVVTVDQPSPDRRDLAADPLCGGCVYAHMTYPRQLAVKGLVIEDAFARIGRLDLPARVAVSGSPEEGYRMRARLHVRGGRAGFFREGTHDLCPARETRQLLPATSDTVDRLVAALRSLGMAESGELELSENIDASQRVVHLDSSAAASPRAFTGLAMSEGLTGFTVSLAARGPRATVVSGDPHVVDVLDIDGTSISLRRHVLAFFQGNRFLLGPLVSHVAGHVPAGADVIDLYAGTGLFSVAAAASQGATVTAVEGDRAGAADLAANASAVRQGSVRAVHQPVESFVTHASRSPDVLIVDPPRTGMSKEALQGALALDARTVVYVSCDVATLARDARKWVDAGYRIASAVGFDLFPNTPHVETVAVFSRA